MKERVGVRLSKYEEENIICDLDSFYRMFCCLVIVDINDSYIGHLVNDIGIKISYFENNIVSKILNY